MRQMGDAKHVRVNVSMKNPRFSSQQLLANLRNLRGKGVTFTSIEKILVIAVYLTSLHRSNASPRPRMNIADLAHGLFETFPDAAGVDQPLYLYGKLHNTAPMLNGELVRTNLFGPKAELKRWFDWDVPAKAFVVNDEGLRRAAELLELTQKRNDSNISASIGPRDSIIDATTSEYLDFKARVQADLALIRSIKRLRMMRRPAQPLDTDRTHLIRKLREESKSSDKPLVILSNALTNAISFYQTEADHLKTPDARKNAAEQINDLHRLFERCCSILKRPEPAPLISHPFRRRTRGAGASLALH